jgi:hypothetical protein
VSISKKWCVSLEISCEKLGFNKRQCQDCSYDGREDNDAFYGVSITVTLQYLSHRLPKFDPIDREPIDDPNVSQNKEGKYQCKKHGSASMSVMVFQRMIA